MLNLLIIFLLLLLISFYIHDGVKETFDGIGKGFGQYHPPKKCCKSNDCYPGMYLSNSFMKDSN